MQYSDIKNRMISSFPSMQMALASALWSAEIPLLAQSITLTVTLCSFSPGEIQEGLCGSGQSQEIIVEKKENPRDFEEKAGNDGSWVAQNKLYGRRVPLVKGEKIEDFELGSNESQKKSQRNKVYSDVTQPSL